MLGVRLIPKLAKTTMVRHAGNFSGSVISGPPRVHVPFAEKMVLAAIMTTGFLIGPAWVFGHIHEYKGTE